MKKILLGLTIACAALSTATAAPVLSQNFESAMLPWTAAVTGGGAGWTIVSGATATQLGSIAAHTKYAVVNEGALTGTNRNNPATMTSPVFSLAGVTSPYLSYDRMYFQAWLSASPYTHELAYIEMSTNGGSTYSLVDSIVYTASSDWETKFVSLSAYAGMSNCVIRFTYTDQGGKIIGLALDNILVYDAAATDIGLNSVSPLAGSAGDYFAVGSGATFSGTVTNYNATTAITSFTAYYQVGSGTPVSNTIGTSVSPLSSAPFTFTTPYTIPSATSQNVKIWVTCTGETYLNNDSMSTAVVGVAFMPKKRLLFEEATGTWCGWCVRGIVYMDSLWRADSANVNIVSVHNSDPMQSANSSTIAYDNLIGNMVGGFPSMIIDRREENDPSGCFTDYANENGYYGYADMGIKADKSGSKVVATVKVKPASDMTGDYRIELIVEEDEVTTGGGSAGTWLQHNYYAVGGSGHGTPMHTIGYDFNNLPTDIPGVKFPFVARYTVPASVNPTSGTPNGIAGSLPSSMTGSTVYTFVDSSVVINSSWNRSKLRVIALLIDNNSSNSTFGNVLNSVSTPGIFTGVEDKTISVANMTVFPNPATDMAHIRFDLNDAATVNFSVVDVMGRTVFTAPAEGMAAGAHQINISTADFASGVYNVIISTENGQVTQRLSVVK